MTEEQFRDMMRDLKETCRAFSSDADHLETEVLFIQMADPATSLYRMFKLYEQIRDIHKYPKRGFRGGHPKDGFRGIETFLDVLLYDAHPEECEAETLEDQRARLLVQLKLEHKFEEVKHQRLRNLSNDHWRKE